MARWEFSLNSHACCAQGHPNWRLPASEGRLSHLPPAPSAGRRPTFCPLLLCVILHIQHLFSRVLLQGFSAAATHVACVG